MKQPHLMKALILISGTFLITFAAKGQFLTYSANSVSHTRHTNAGNVLIGSTTQTTAPQDKLEVVGNVRGNQFNAVNGVYNSLTSLFLQTSGATRLTINGTGNVGIGVASPGHTLDVGGFVNATGFKIAGANVVSSQWANNGTNINFTANGVVSIGTANAPFGYKLAVGGKIVAEEVVVKLQSNWPDYVFEEDYKMMPLGELRTYIKMNKHLPGVPTANEIENNGIAIGEMNSILLKKIEELTLLLLQQDERIKVLENNLKK